MPQNAVRSSEQSAEQQDRQRWIALVVLCAGFLMIILDQTIVNVALPSIQSDLDFTQSSLAWVVNAYLIAFGGLLLLAGRLGDLIGRKRIFLAGLTVFTLASLLCGAAQTQEMLIGARFLQGIGGAMTSAVILGMIVAMFPEPGEQARAIGIYAFVASAGASIGLLAGGVLTEAINWHWIFFVNLPIGVLTGVLSMRLLEHEDGIGLGRGADLPGALLIVSALMLAVYTIVGATDHGWGSLHTLGLGAIAVALLVGFVLRQAHAANPLVPLRIFRSRIVSVANLVQALMVAGMFGMFFLGALYMQRVLGYDAIEVGLAFLPVALAIGALSAGVSAKLIMRFGARATLLPGLVAVAAGLVLFQRAPVDADYVVDLLPVMLLLGVGGGLAFPSLMTLAMSGATPADSGLASGLVNTTQQVGGALGLAVLATLSTTRSGDLLADGSSTAHALTSGYHLAFAIGAGLVLAAIVLTATLLTPERRRRDEEPVRRVQPAYADEAA
jgi:EmrB/QacA subfamily drug resistance transporter